MRWFARSAVAALLLVAPAVRAQNSEVGEVIVTAERAEYDPATVPAVVLIRRADNMVVQITVTCDTRDAVQRRGEMLATLRSLLRESAQDPRIDVGLAGETADDHRVLAFNESMFDAIIRPGGRPDTSTISFLLKTDVVAADSYDTATGRLRTFVAHVQRAGRTEVLVSGSFELTIVRPAQYRAAILGLVSADARAAAEAFGPGYGVRIVGLQRPVQWYVAAPLDLALYVPYSLEIGPAGIAPGSPLPPR